MKKFIAVITVLSLSIFLYIKKMPVANVEPALPVVTTIKATTGDLPHYIEVPSTAESVQTVKIFPRVEGELLKIHFKEGQIVEEGQPLFTLDSDLNQQQLQALEAQLKDHKARKDYYKKEQTRYERLVTKDYATQEQYDQSVMNSLTEAAAIEQVDAQIKQILLNIKYSKINSPVTGKVGFVNAYEGTYIKTNDVNPLVTIVKMDPIRFPVFLPEKYLENIQNSGPTYIVKDQKGTIIADAVLNKARFDAQDNRVDSSLGNICVKVAVDNPLSQILPGMYTTVKVVFEYKEGIKIPLSCLQKGQEGDYVYVYKPDSQKVKMTPITVAVLDDISMIVTKGLQEGDQVVVQGQIRLRDGIVVNAKPISAEGSL